jgi:hypothetical protein
MNEIMSEKRNGKGAHVSQEQLLDTESRRGRKPTLANQGKLKRYNLVLPEDLYKGIQKIAENQHMMVIEVLRKFIKLGILAADIAQDPGSKLIIRETGKMDREILLL